MVIKSRKNKINHDIMLFGAKLPLFFFLAVLNWLSNVFSKNIVTFPASVVKKVS